MCAVNVNLNLELAPMAKYLFHSREERARIAAQQTVAARNIAKYILTDWCVANDADPENPKPLDSSLSTPEEIRFFAADAGNKKLQRLLNEAAAAISGFYDPTLATKYRDASSMSSVEWLDRSERLRLVSSELRDHAGRLRSRLL